MQKIKPKFLCDNLQDTGVTVLVAVVQMAVLFGVPGLLGYWLTGSEGVAWSVVIGMYLLFLSFSVFSISVGEEGIKFNRLFGSPKSLSWADIKEIDEVSPRELIVDGWLWPLFPTREMTPCLSSRGHFKITYHGGHCYYPPEDVELFSALVKQYKSKVLS